MGEGLGYVRILHEIAIVFLVIIMILVKFPTDFFERLEE